MVDINIITVAIIIVIFLLMLLVSAIKIMAEYQRIVIFRLGRLFGIKGFKAMRYPGYGWRHINKGKKREKKRKIR
ncbi:unnamed protein product [marine sediment metagenome]|uniref:Band 7 domain-containing protein n=1 Tax=marine sediment metagenome TaxID=412755 RepID=X1AZY1_9ZZZZ